MARTGNGGRTVEQAGRQQFLELVAHPGSPDALEKGALLIAARARPQLRIDAHIERLDRLAESARQWVNHIDPAQSALQLGRYLHRELGYSGNIDDYYDPANSYFDQVLERRLGIPITLAILYIAVARRLGLALDAVGFPGHVLLGVDADGQRQLLDPFTGEAIDRRTCRQLLQRLFGRQVALQPQWFEALPVPAIWFRMLGNLRQIHMERRAYTAALECCDWQLLIDPRAPQELLDRGLLLEQLGHTAAARTALRHFLMLHPRHHAAAAVQVKIDELASRARWLH